MNYVIQSKNLFYVKSFSLGGFPIALFGKITDEVKTFLTSEEAQAYIDANILIKECKVSLNIFSI